MRAKTSACPFGTDGKTGFSYANKNKSKCLEAIKHPLDTGVHFQDEDENFQN